MRREMTVQEDLYLCGWRISSEIPLPELRVWSTPGAAVDIRIRVGEVPYLPDQADQNRRLFISESGDCRLYVEGIATFGIYGGREVVINPYVSSDSIAMRNYVFGTVLGVLCHQRGVLPFHGSCLQIGNQAVIFSGDSGAGKSTLAAALVQAGCVMIADDVCAMKFAKDGWLVQPAFPRVKLHPAAHRAIFGSEPSEARVGLQGKHHFCFDDVEKFSAQPVLLHAIYFLELGQCGDEQRIEVVEGLECIHLVQSQIFRRGIGVRMGRRLQMFHAAAQIADAVKVCRLIRPFDLSQLSATVDLLMSQRVELST